MAWLLEGRANVPANRNSLRQPRDDCVSAAVSRSFAILHDMEAFGPIALPTLPIPEPFKEGA